MRDNHDDQLDPVLQAPWLSLRLAYGVVPIVAGLDKFTNILTDWTQYLGPLARLLPVSPGVFMRGVGVIEIVAGILVLSRFARLGAYVVSAWLVDIALNLLSSGHFLAWRCGISSWRSARSRSPD
jgi:uncharacterized membrane protein YphA (DoxX/SURF4 family)